MKKPEEYGRIAYEHYRGKFRADVSASLRAWDELESDEQEDWTRDAMAVVEAVRQEYEPLVEAALNYIETAAGVGHEGAEIAYATLVVTSQRFTDGW